MEGAEDRVPRQLSSLGYISLPHAVWAINSLGHEANVAKSRAYLLDLFTKEDTKIPVFCLIYENEIK